MPARLPAGRQVYHFATSAKNYRCLHRKFTHKFTVPKRGFEPPILTEHGSEPCASTISPLRRIQNCLNSIKIG